MSQENTNPRSVATTPIAESYLGILRVGNNVDLINETPDNILDPTYYTNEEGNDLNTSGINVTHSFINSETPNARYSGRDAYSNLKLPVTDSVGHFLNLSLGENGAEIGKFISTGELRDAQEQFTDEDTITFATVDTTNYITIGLSERVLEATKTVHGGSLTIDSVEDYPGTLVIRNYYCHGLDSNKQDSILPANSNKKLRTIIKDKGDYKKFDAFIYDQENFILTRYGNDGDENKVIKDCVISLENIKKYVNNRLVSYVDDNKRDLPAGTILSQYCSLDKWYCLDNKGEINEGIWQGYRPAMYESSNAPFSYWNNIQGRAFRGDQYLYYDGFTTDQLTTEAAPDFKRGYLLCNGESYTMNFMPKYIQTGEIAHKTVDLFADLFYVLGHYYQNDERYENGNTVYYTPLMRKVVTGETNDDGTASYSFSGIGNNTINEDTIQYSKAEPVKITNNSNCPTDYNVLYARDMAILTAFKVMDDFIALDALNVYTTKDSIINWLKGQTIPDQYIFNVIDPSFKETQGGATVYPYKNVIEYISNGTTIKVDIGREINNFTEKIPYYTYSSSGYTKKLVEIYNMAEVQYMAELFAKRRTSNFWEHMKITFFLPKLFTCTDTEVNIGESYRLYNTLKDILPEKTVGLFPGSNALTLSTSINLAHRQGENMKIDTTVQSQSFICNYNFTPALEPHAHALMGGTGSYFDEGSREIAYSHHNSYGYTPKSVDSSLSRINTFMNSDIVRDNNILKQDPEKKFIAAANYHSSLQLGRTELSNDPQLNYIFQENDQATLQIKYNSYSGQHGWEYGLDGYKWFGATSGPVWEENTAITPSNYGKYETVSTGFQGYFRPESIKVLPLIKL